MILTICKVSILTVAGLLVLTPVLPLNIQGLTFLAGLTVLLSSIPYLSRSYKKAVYIFLLLSGYLLFKYHLSLGVLVAGVNSMLPIVATVAVLQLFVIPFRVGNYDRVLQHYLQTKFKKQSSLYLFLTLISHLLSSFMLFGTVPMLYTMFKESLTNMLSDHKRFTVTALSRSFALVTLWSPGSINIILCLQATGANWLQVVWPVICIAVIGFATSIFMEVKFHIKDKVIQTAAVSTSESDNWQDDPKENRKIYTLLFIAIGLIFLIILMEKFRILTGTTRVLIAGLTIISILTLRYARKPGLYSAWRGYWEKSINVVPDLAALFISMGIFSEVFIEAELITYFDATLNSGINIFGTYILLFIPLIMVLLSLIGIHPFISILLIGKMFVLAIPTPGFEAFVALSLIVGAAVSYIVSPFAGSVLTLSKMVDCSPLEVAFKWNGLFAFVLLLEGLMVLSILQVF